MWVYVLFFLILFLETWVSVTAFLPGDAILFGMGALAASSETINIWVMVFVLCVAAILGDSLNYKLGRIFSNEIKNKEQIPLIKMEHIAKTQGFFEHHGNKTITIARFLPIIRTAAPFISGAAHMKYSKFLFYNIFGGILWVCAGFGVGYFFGNLNIVKDNFSIIVIIFLLILLTPLAINYIREKRKYA